MHAKGEKQITVANVAARLEKLAPLALQESYDNCGLLAGEADTVVKGVLVSLDVTEAVVEEAIQKGCNLIVSHHPLIFSGIKSLSGKNWVERTLIKAIRHNICLYASHTNLDNIATGVNAVMAEKIGLQNSRVLSPKRGTLKKLVTFVPTADLEQVRAALFAAGGGQIGLYDQASFSHPGTGTFRPLEGTNPHIGTIGAFTEVAETRLEILFENHRQSAVLKALFASHPYEEVAYDIYALENKQQDVGSGRIGELAAAVPTMTFLQTLQNTFGGGLRYTHISKNEVQKIALCGGSGSFLLEDAIAAGADVLVTADFKYHQFLEADKRIIIADIGHFESEQFTITLLTNYLRENFTNFATLSTETKTNPVNYL